MKKNRLLVLIFLLVFAAPVMRSDDPDPLKQCPDPETPCQCVWDSSTGSWLCE